MMKQKKERHLKQRTGDLSGDIEYAQEELDDMQEQYDKYLLSFHINYTCFLPNLCLQMSKQFGGSWKKPWKSPEAAL